jgi:cytochrome P450
MPARWRATRPILVPEVGAGPCSAAGDRFPDKPLSKENYLATVQAGSFVQSVRIEGVRSGGVMAVGVIPDGAVSPFAATANGLRQQIYADLSAAGPVHRVVMPSGVPAWLITGPDEVRAALADQRLIKAGPNMTRASTGLPPGIDKAMNSDLLHLDPPDHTRLRKLVMAAFTRRRVEQLAPRMAEIADQLLDDVTGDAGSVDLIDRYAFPLPMTVICELLGVPMADAGVFRGWSTTIITGSLADPTDWAHAAVSLVSYIRTLVAEKRVTPTGDLLSGLIASRDGSDRLSEDELTSMVVLLLIAGHETTVNLIGNALNLLLQHPAQLAGVLAAPEHIPGVLEEVLRFEGPVQVATPRFAAEPITIAGTVIPAGAMVFASVLAAGRHAGIEGGDQFDPDRRHQVHLSFGHGIHYCLGAQLARTEAAVALRRLLARYPDVRLAVRPDELTWRPSVLMHGLNRLPVLLGRSHVGPVPSTQSAPVSSR